MVTVKNWLGGKVKHYPLDKISIKFVGTWETWSLSNSLVGMLTGSQKEHETVTKVQYSSSPPPNRSLLQHETKPMCKRTNLKLPSTLVSLPLDL
jgi:hypothetical protein